MENMHTHKIVPSICLIGGLLCCGCYAGENEDDNTEIRITSSLLKPFKIERLASGNARKGIDLRIADAKFSLPEALSISGTKPEKSSDSGSQWKLAYNKDEKSTPAYLQFVNFKTKYGFYVPESGKSKFARVNLYWDLIRTEEKKFKSTVDSLDMLQKLDAHPTGEGLTPEEALLLAAKYHVRRIKLGLNESFLYKCPDASLLVRYIIGDNKNQGVAVACVFDETGSYRGDLMFHMPYDELVKNDNEIVKSLALGIKFPK